MTHEELRDKFKTLLSPIERPTPFQKYGFETEDGWNNLIYCLFLELEQLDVDKKVRVTQVKEKFALLRCYVEFIDDYGNNPLYESYRDNIYNVLNKYEAESAYTCEYCGKKGKVRTNRHWIKTLCEECNARGE